MKKIVIAIIGALFTLSLFAHPPKSVDLTFNKEKSELTVELPHPVKDVRTHYIEYVLITINGKEYKKIDYTSQTSKEEHKVVIPIEAKAGDKIEVEAECNKMGKRSSSIVIE